MGCSAKYYCNIRLQYFLDFVLVLYIKMEIDFILMNYYFIFILRIQPPFISKNLLLFFSISTLPYAVLPNLRSESDAELVGLFGG
jgi:hypothetical protein